MNRQPSEVLSQALSHFQTMQVYADRDLDDQVVIDAICMRLSAGVETLAALEPDFRNKLFGDDWPLMWGMRNRIAHGYMLVSPAIVRQTLHHDLPAIISRIQTSLIDDP